MYDYVIVGAGSAGCVLAHRLSEDPRRRVLLIESDADLVARVAPTMSCNWLEGDACEVSTLHTAGLADSDVVCVLTPLTETFPFES